MAPRIVTYYSEADLRNASQSHSDQFQSELDQLLDAIDRERDALPTRLAKCPTPAKAAAP